MAEVLTDSGSFRQEGIPQVSEAGGRTVATPRAFLAKYGRTVGPFIILPVLMITFEALNTQFLTLNNFYNMVAAAAVPLVLAVGMTFVILMGSIDLSVGSVVTLVGVAGAVMLRDYGALTLLLIPVLGLACGFVNGYLFAYANLPSFLVTLGTMYAYSGAALFIVNGSSVTLNPSGALWSTFGGYFGSFPGMALWALGALVISMFIARNTRFGRYTYVLGGGETVARLSGVPIRRQKLYVFMFSGLLAAFAGMLLMFRIQGADPDMGSDYLLTTIAAVVMGGTPLTGGLGSPLRSLLGVIIIVALNDGMTLANVQPYLQTVILGCVVILAVALAMDRTRIFLMK